jgi:predicted GNAT superfamily acetyltransferase
VRQRLLAGYRPHAPNAPDAVPEYSANAPALARLAIPSDIDTLLASDPEDARNWRIRTRAALEAAFAAGYAITGFAGQTDSAAGYLLLERGLEHVS